MKKIAIFSTTRADLGIFSALIRQIEQRQHLDYLLFAGGAHLAPELGQTIHEIETLKFKLTASFDYLLNEDSSASMSRSMGMAVFQLTEIFQHHSFDLVCVLGDRIELLPIVMTAILFKKPIIHIHGGEKSEGVMDEQVRHMVTKAAHIHFAACATYAENIRQMGEPAWRIHNTGALAVDNMLYYTPIPKEDLFSELELDTAKPTVLLTYHPVTLEFNIPPVEQIENLFAALAFRPDLQVVITAPNMDVGRERIISCIRSHVAVGKNYRYINSLGVLRYFSLLPHCLFVMGNSSSGIIEVPFFKIPTINIGDRQKGRLCHPSIITTDYSILAIGEGITKALTPQFRQSLKTMDYLFGNGTAAQKMTDVLEELTINEPLLRKEFNFYQK